MKQQANNPVTGALPDLPLRDIHLPEPVSWWPPAPGWWLLLALSMLAIAAAALLLRRHKRKRRQRRVIEQFESVQAAYGTHRDRLRLARELSVLMRRACISFYPRRDTASLTGERWLSWLDRTSTSKGFSVGAGRLLASAPYTDRLDAGDRDIEQLLGLCRDWLHANADRLDGCKP